jgi:2-oxoglutarate ferredoxin oxidoreductase subunit alpha
MEKNQKGEIELLSGNEAIVRGAQLAKISFFSSYPITPASEIMEAIAKSPVRFIQGEDEIAACNMCIGASMAGAKAMIATSGPGFSLTQESIGLAFKIRAPLVVIDCQRVGPSTGMPTSSSQGDILQAKHGSHGDYINIVFSPNSVAECLKYTIESVNAAEESLSPVILIVDGIISHLYETVNTKVSYQLEKRSLKPLGQGKRHFTGLTSKGNLPVTKGPQTYRNWYQKRKKEILDIAEKYNFYQYLENKESNTLLIGYGIASRVILPLKEKYSIFRPIRLFPPIKKLKKIAEKYSRLVIVEMNDGQYQHELQSFLQREIELISQLGGEIKLREIKDALK